MGLTYEDDLKLRNTYDYGANVGEWLWDLFHNEPIRRWPWVQREYIP